MSNASELFKRVVSRMSFRHPDNTRSLSTPEILENIAKAMEKAEQWEEKRAKLRKDREDADTKYQHALDVIRMQEKQLQRRRSLSGPWSCCPCKCIIADNGHTWRTAGDRVVVEGCVIPPVTVWLDGHESRSREYRSA